MIVVLMAGLIIMGASLHGIVRAADVAARMATRLARRGSRRQSATYVKSAAVLAAVADRILNRFG